MKIQELEHKKILILGFGKEGHATYSFLKPRLHSSVIEYTDQTLDPNYLEKQKNYDLVIKTPGIPKTKITVPYTTATNIFFANCPGKIIGVTGTKGKSTTASLIHHMLQVAGYRSHLVGNIGNPALEELPKGDTQEDIFVIELSSYQLDDIAYSPHVCVVLNLFPEHMNYHGTSTAYYEAKKNIIKYTCADDYFIYNQDYKELEEWAHEAKCQSRPFDSGDTFSGDSVLLGAHNQLNIRAAITAVRLFHVQDESIHTALKTFKPLPHRLEKVGTYGGIVFFDDAISTTPQSTMAALLSLKNVDTLFLGGLDRGYDFDPLTRLIKKINIANIVLFPDSSTQIKKSLQANSVVVSHILETKSMKEAVEFGFAHTKKSKICLLSTASPSYSLWKNFEEKGNEFKHYIEEYAQNKKLDRK